MEETYNMVDDEIQQLEKTFLGTYVKWQKQWKVDIEQIKSLYKLDYDIPLPEANMDKY